MKVVDKPDSETSLTQAQRVFFRRIETVSVALTGIRKLSLQGDAQAERQFTMLAADMEKYLAHLKCRIE